MDDLTLLAQFDRDMRRDLVIPDMRRDALARVVRYVRPAPGMSVVLYSRLDATSADAAITEQAAYFTARNMPYEWKVYAHDRPADLGVRLLARGLVADEPDDVMVLDLATASPALLAPVAADIRPITTRTGLSDVISVLEAVWGRSFAWVTDRLGAHLAVPGYLDVYVAYADNQPVSAAWIYYYEGSRFAGLWGGSTLDGYRRRGLYTALLATRVQAALRRGYRYLTVDAGPMSRPIVAQHGFRRLTQACSYSWTPPDSAESPP